MEPITTAALIGAGAGVFNGITSFFGGQKAADKSVEISRQNMKDQLAWEREKATNAYQWAAEDLEKAGLNKNLLNMHAGAAVAGSLTPQMPDTSGYQTAYNSMGNMIKDTLNTAIGVKEKIAQINNIEASTAKTQEDSALSRAMAITEAAKAGYIDAQTAHELLKKESTRMRNELDSKYSEYERMLGIGKQVSGIIRDVTTPLAQFFGLGKFGNMLKGVKQKGYGMTQNGSIYNKRTGEIMWE